MLNVVGIAALLSLSVGASARRSLFDFGDTFTVLATNANASSRAVNRLTDLDVLTFALNLECLEAEVFSYAAYGQSIPESVLGRPASQTVGGRKGSLGMYQPYAEELALLETNHINFLRSLGVTGACPPLDIGGAFDALAKQATGNASAIFSPYDGPLNFQYANFLFADVGATAYQGSLGVLQNRVNIEGAGSLLGIEGYQSGGGRLVIFDADNTQIPGTSLGAVPLADALIAAVGKLGGGKVRLISESANDGPVHVIPSTPDQGIVFERTPSEVLRIVYGGGDTSGGFFPSGFNGKVKDATDKCAIQPKSCVA